MSVEICTGNPMIDQDIELFQEALRDDELMSSGCTPSPTS